jgi:hypothetical protein
MTWTVHKKSFNQTPAQLMDRISKYYETHRDAAGLSVVEVWQRLDAQDQFDKGADNQGEAWKNAHWYLNGDWWTQSSEDQQLGFVEGYLWCMKSQAPAPTDMYSDSPKAYRQKINSFVSAHPKLGNESVAVTLRRFRDRDLVSSPHWLLNAEARRNHRSERLTGNPDNQGSAALNQKLSQDRAASVIAWQAAHGVEQKRLSPQGFGASRPVADNGTEAGRALNRRVEMSLVK